MTAVQIADVLRHFGADVLLLAAGVTLVTSLLKKTVLKRLSARLYVFLPFIIGILLYAVYRMIATWSILPLTGDIRITLEGGFSCGSAATLYYAVYEQFVRKDKTSPVLPLLELVPEETRQEAADAIYAKRNEEDFVSIVSELLLRYAPDATDDERTLVTELVVRYIKTLPNL